MSNPHKSGNGAAPFWGLHRNLHKKLPYVAVADPRRVFFLVLYTFSDYGIIRYFQMLANEVILCYPIDNQENRSEYDGKFFGSVPY